jgi:uracil-DNA glycosylase family 4
MFTGDRSGDWLYRALYKAGLANQPSATHQDDGLKLYRVMITATCHCAPPDNKPTPDEIRACSRHLQATLALRPWSAALALGSIAWNELHRNLGMKAPKFTHGAKSRCGDLALFASFHPSQQNTFTGRLTEEMLDEVVAEFVRCLKK